MLMFRLVKNAIQKDNAARRAKVVCALAGFRLTNDTGAYNLLVRLLQAEGRWDVDTLRSEALTLELLALCGFPLGDST